MSNKSRISSAEAIAFAMITGMVTWCGMLLHAVFDYFGI